MGLMHLEEGIVSLSGECRGKEITVVGITSRGAPEYFEDAISRLERGGIHPTRRFSYTPPNEVGGKWRDPIDRNIYPERFETVPIIRNPEGVFIICDDYLEKGGTLRFAVIRLEEQGVSKESIWGWVAGVVDCPQKSPRKLGFLDRYNEFERFLKDRERR